MEVGRFCCEDKGCCWCKLCKARVRLRGREDEGKAELWCATGERKESSEN